jgi:hypothetical protein
VHVGLVVVERHFAVAGHGAAGDRRAGVERDRGQRHVVPVKCVFVPSVAELPTCQKTLQPWASPRRGAP